jgi:hypothetical protein
MRCSGGSSEAGAFTILITIRNVMPVNIVGAADQASADDDEVVGWHGDLPGPEGAGKGCN